MNSTINFGEHITIDGYGGNHDLLNSKEIVLECLTGLLERLGMTPLAEPVVYFAPGNNGKDPGGWSGFVVIVESHVSIHTFPGRGFLSADVYTCKNGMDQTLVVDYFKEKFQLQDAEVNFIKRGTKYPDANFE